jgi:hypothetical protein
MLIVGYVFEIPHFILDETQLIMAINSHAHVELNERIFHFKNDLFHCPE